MILEGLYYYLMVVDLLWYVGLATVGAVAIALATLLWWGWRR